MINKENINIGIIERSDEFQEILSKTPNWIIRWGISIILTITLVTLLASWFIKFPEVITANILITTKAPPSRVVMKTSGRISKFFVLPGEVVNKHQYIGFVDNPASIDEILELEKFLKNFEVNGEYEEPKLENIGELEYDFTIFMQSLNNYKQFVITKEYETQKKNILIQISVFEKILGSSKRQVELKGVENEIQRQRFESQSKLKDKMLISESEFMSAKQSYTAVESALVSAKITKFSNDLRLSEYIEKLDVIEHQYITDKRKLLDSVETSYKALNSKFDEYKKKYIIESPTTGKVSFANIWSETRHYQVDDTIMYIVGNDRNIIGKINLKRKGAGKVKIGQLVKVKLDQYNFYEFGMLTGKITNISQVQGENGYLVDVEFKNELHTTYNKTLEFEPELQGTADIITQDTRLLEHLTSKLYSAMKNNI